LTNVLRTLRPVTSGNLICLMGVGPQQSETDCAEIGRVLEHYSDRSVLTGRQLDRKLSLRNAHDVLDGFDRPAQAHLMPNRAKAICWALSQARPGDIVVLAGGVESTGPDQVTLCDADVTRYWLQHVALPGECPWAPV
jgi:UDP-N-acetylmuramoyl-L-alanyl-D-glutamate--2,6-diaminopimelate ligase